MLLLAFSKSKAAYFLITEKSSITNSDHRNMA
nr:MAG TPA: hypothetical protein [Caudoviricetes sp.]